MDARQSYLAGEYQSAIKAKNNVKTMAYKIGALVFTAHHHEARALFEEFQQQFTLDSLVLAQFHMGISYTRTSDYRRAKGYFYQNLNLQRHNSLTSESCFFVYQGLSFFRFFFSQHKKSQKAADKGYQFLLKEPDAAPLLRALSLDIQGHNLIQMGRIHLGLKSLKRALLLTKENHLTALHSELEISCAIYESDFDLDLSQQEHKLKKILKVTQSTNDYSCSELVLQIAKLLFLQGQVQNSRQFLTDHFHMIYDNENKRKVAKLNTLLAQILMYKGHWIEALSMIHVAQKNLNEETDLSLLLPILGLKAKILKQLGDKESQNKTEAEQITQKIDRNVNKRIQRRTHSQKISFQVTEDKLGDLFDQVDFKDHSSLNEIIRSKVLILIPRFFDFIPGQKKVVVCEPYKVFFIIDHEQIQLIEKSMTKSQIHILKCLSQNEMTKQKLIEEVWGYEYDPLRHDSLIYTSMTRMRRMFGKNKDWLASDDQKYYLAHDVEVEFYGGAKPIERLPIEPKEDHGVSDLNYRQLQMIQDPPVQALSVSEYGELWGVTRMTALRDLKYLCDKGWVQKIGVGRATRYLVLS